jgi:hypothetical protein
VRYDCSSSEQLSGGLDASAFDKSDALSEGWVLFSVTLTIFQYKLDL